MAALDVAVARVAPDMIPRYVSETMRGYAMLGGVVKDELGLPMSLKGFFGFNLLHHRIEFGFKMPFKFNLCRYSLEGCRRSRRGRRWTSRWRGWHRR